MVRTALIALIALMVDASFQLHHHVLYDRDNHRRTSPKQLVGSPVQGRSVRLPVIPSLSFVTGCQVGQDFLLSVLGCEIVRPQRTKEKLWLTDVMTV